MDGWLAFLRPFQQYFSHVIMMGWCIMACDMFSHNMAYICHANIVKQNLKGMNKQTMMHIIYFVLLINI